MEVAREMVVMPDYVLPHLNGKIYSEKPPMFFWLAGLLYKAGMGYMSGRVVSILAVLGALLLVYAAFRKSLGESATVLAGATALSTLLLMHFTKIGVLDTLFMFFVTTALISGYYALRKETERRWLFWLGSYAAMGLGTLTKGPVAIALVALPLLVYAVLNRKNVRAGGLAHLLGAGVFAAYVLAWLVPVILAWGFENTWTNLVKQTAGRAVASYSHRQPFYYYVLHAPWYFFPWSFLLPLAITSAVREWRREGNNALIFAVTWLIVPIVFFSLMSGKRMNYIVPTLPAAGVLCGWYLLSDRRKEGKLPGIEKWLLGAAFVMLIVSALALGVCVALASRILPLSPLDENDVRRILAGLTPGGIVLTLAMFALPIALSVAGLLQPAHAAARRAAILAAAVLSFSLPQDVTIAPAMNIFKSGKVFAQEINRQAGNSKEVYTYRQSYSGVYNLYSDRATILVLGSPEGLKKALQSPKNLIFGDRPGLERALSGEKIERYIVFQEGVGHRDMVLLQGIAP
jgi:hypothetical protein